MKDLHQNKVRNLEPDQDRKRNRLRKKPLIPNPPEMYLCSPKILKILFSKIPLKQGLKPISNPKPPEPDIELQKQNQLKNMLM